MSLGLYTVKLKDFGAGFDCAVKDGKKLRNILHMPIQMSQHMMVYNMKENSYIKIIQT